MFRAHAQRWLDEPSHSHSIPWWPRHVSDEEKLGELSADVEPGPKLKEDAFDDRSSNENAFDTPAQAGPDGSPHVPAVPSSARQRAAAQKAGSAPAQVESRTAAGFAEASKCGTA